MIRSGRNYVKPILFIAVLIAIFGALHVSSTRMPAVRREQAKRVMDLRRKLADYYPENYNRGGPRLNYMALDRLGQCLEENNCDPGSDTVVVLVSHHFAQSRVGWNAGEEIWAHSMHVAFDSLNYTILYAISDVEMLFIYQHIPDLIPILLVQPGTIDSCIARNNSNYLDLDSKGFKTDWQKPGKHGCVKKEGFEEGIPLYKMLAWAWWEAAWHPMGRIWTVAPENWGFFKGNKGNTYLGYSVEDRCTQIPFIEEKEHRGFLLAKRAEYINDHSLFSWPDMLPQIAEAIPKDPEGKEFEFFGTFSGSLNPKLDHLRNVGPLDRPVWLEEVAKSKFMLGVGRPYLSPSPYDAMCFGVPFINVIYGVNERDPEDPKGWRTQHDALKFEVPPYVYHARQGDQASLQKAIDAAIANPIDRYIPAAMTLEATRERHRVVATTDWESLAMEHFPEWFGPGKPYLP